MIGQSSFALFNKQLPTPPPPPVPVQTMQNGLSLVGTAGELGLNPLLHDTSFDLQTFEFAIQNNGFNKFVLHPDLFFSHFDLGDIDGEETGMKLLIHPTDNYVEISDSGGANMSIDNVGKEYQFGNLRFGDNKAHFAIADSQIDFTFFYGSNRILDFNDTVGQYKFGDLDLQHNGNQMSIDDFSNSVSMSNNAGIQFEIDNSVRTYNIGDLSHSNNGNNFKITDSSSLYDFTNQTNNNQFEVNLATVGTMVSLVDNLGFIFRADRSTGIVSAPPTGGGGAGTWQLGKNNLAAVVFDATQYIEVNIDGVLYKLAIVN